MRQAHTEAEQVYDLGIICAKYEQADAILGKTMARAAKGAAMERLNPRPQS